MTKDTDTLWFQCRLKRDNTETIAYIAERGAKLGNSVELKTPGVEGFWRVISVSRSGKLYADIKKAEKRLRDPHNFASIN